MAAETQTQKAQIHTLERADIPRLRHIAQEMKSAKDIDYFERNFDFVEKGERQIFLAVSEGQDTSYCILNWDPKYALFRKQNTPEIQDLNVLPVFRQRGIGTMMILHCEEKASEKGCGHMGIGVGVDASFGPAQKLYARLGYQPDGCGVTYDRKLVETGSFKPVDDQLCLMMLKSLEKGA